MGRSKQKHNVDHVHEFIVLQTPALGNFVRGKHTNYGPTKNSWAVRGCRICGQIQRIFDGQNGSYNDVDNYAAISGRYWHGIGMEERRPKPEDK